MRDIRNRAPKNEVKSPKMTHTEVAAMHFLLAYLLACSLDNNKWGSSSFIFWPCFVSISETSPNPFKLPRKWSSSLFASPYYYSSVPQTEIVFNPFEFRVEILSRYRRSHWCKEEMNRVRSSTRNSYSGRIYIPCAEVWIEDKRAFSGQLCSNFFPHHWTTLTWATTNHFVFCGGTGQKKYIQFYIFVGGWKRRINAAISICAFTLLP